MNARTKIVVALYPFKAVESGDLSLEKVSFILVSSCEDLEKNFPIIMIRFQGKEYEIIDDSREHWWEAKDQFGYV